MSANDKAKQISDEKDLNDLLDSALNDFETSDESTDCTNTVHVETGGSGDDGSDADLQKVWNDDFFAEQTKLLSDRMSGLFGGPNEQQPTAEQMNLGFQKLAEAAALALQGDLPADNSSSTYADSITEALKGLQDGVQNLQAPISENDVASMFNGLGLAEESDGNPFLPFMQGMMQSLLSAEILLPSINELLSKYPKYLKDNADKISTEDKERYEKQFTLFQTLRTDLESEKPDDSATVKQERFKRVLEVMQKLHDYGQPPNELIADVGGGFGLPGLDAFTGGSGAGPGAGLGALDSNNQCPTM